MSATKFFAGKTYNWERLDKKPLGDGAGKSGEAWLVKNQHDQRGVLKKPQDFSETARDIFSEKECLRTLYKKVRESIPSDIDFSYSIPRVLDEGDNFVVMSQAEGVSLKDLLELKYVSKEHLLFTYLRIIIGVLEIIRVAHSNNFVYRDYIKYEHVYWCDKAGMVTLIDWGNATLFNPKTGWTNDENPYENLDDVREAKLKISKILKDFPADRDHILLSVADNLSAKDQLDILISNTYRVYQQNETTKKQSALKKKMRGIESRLDTISSINEYKNIISEIQKHEHHFKANEARLVSAYRSLLVKDCYDNSWGGAVEILSDLQSAVIDSDDARNSLYALIEFLKNVDNSDPFIVEWIKDKLCSTIVNTPYSITAEHWLRIVRITSIDFSDLETRSLWRKVVIAVGKLAKKDTSFLYDDLLEIQFGLKEFFDDEEDLKISFLRHWYRDPFAWRGISYQPVLEVINDIRNDIFVLDSDQSVDYLELLSTVEQKFIQANDLSQLIWKHWNSRNFSVANKIFEEIQSLDPDRRQLEKARKLFLDAKNGWGTQAPSTLQEIETELRNVSVAEQVVGEAEWLQRFKTQLLDKRAQLRAKEVRTDEEQLLDGVYQDLNKISVSDLSDAPSSSFAANIEHSESEQNNSHEKPEIKDAAVKDASKGEQRQTKDLQDNSLDNETDFGISEPEEIADAVDSDPGSIEVQTDSSEILHVEECINFIRTGDLENAKTVVGKLDDSEREKKILDLTINLFDSIEKSIFDAPELKRARSFLKQIRKEQESIKQENYIEVLDALVDEAQVILGAWSDLDIDVLSAIELKQNNFAIKLVERLTVVKLVERAFLKNNNVAEFILFVHKHNLNKKNTHIADLVSYLDELYAAWVKIEDNWDIKLWDDFVEKTQGVDIQASLIQAGCGILLPNMLQLEKQTIFSKLNNLKDTVLSADTHYILLSKSSFDDPKLDIRRGEYFLDALQYLNNLFRNRYAPLYASTSNWKDTFIKISKARYFQFEEVKEDLREKIVGHPLENWLNKYYPKPNFFEQIRLSVNALVDFIKNFFVSFMGGVKWLLIILVITIIMLAVGKYFNASNDSFFLKDVASTPVETIVVEEATPANEHAETDVDDGTKTDSFCKAVEDFLQAEEYDSVYRMIFPLYGENADKNAITCGWDGGYEAFLADVAIGLVDQQREIYDFDNALVTLDELYEKTWNPDLQEIQDEILVLKTMAAVCDASMSVPGVTDTGLDALKFFLENQPDFIKQNDEIIRNVCPSTTDLNRVETESKSLLIRNNFPNTNYQDLYWAGAFNTRKKNTSFLFNEYELLPVMMQNIDSSFSDIAYWDSIERVEIEVTRASLDSLEIGTGWGVLIDDYGVALLQGENEIEIYYADNDSDTLSYLEAIPGTLDKFSYLRLQLIGEYVFFTYSYKNEIDDGYLFHHISSMPPLTVSTNAESKEPPKMFLVLYNNTDGSVGEIRIAFNALDVFLFSED